MSDLYPVHFIFDKGCPQDVVVDMINTALEKYNFSITADKIKWFETSPLSVQSLHSSLDFALNLGINLSIPFKKIDSVTETSNVLAARKRYDVAHLRYEKFLADSSVTNFKYDFVTCPHCSSKLNRKYISEDSICPLCHSDLRKDTIIAKIASLKEKADQLETAYNSEVSKNIEQGKFVGVEKLLVVLYLDSPVSDDEMTNFDFSEYTADGTEAAHDSDAEQKQGQFD